MNCLISDAPAWRAINTILDDITEPADVIVLTSEVSATDLARHVLTHPAAVYCHVTVISGQSASVDPAVDLIDRDNYHLAWLSHAANPRKAARFNGNMVLVNVGGRVSAAVGSAPLAGNRWASEREVWTVLRARCGCSSIALHEIAELLVVVALSDTHLSLDPQPAFSLYTTARDIEATEAVDTEARLLSNYHRPIADQLSDLIAGPVDDLAVYTPRYHRHLRGVDTLVDLLQPAHTVTLYKSGRRPNVETVRERLSADSETRTVYTPRSWLRGTSRDATIIQWRTGGQTFALTGLSRIDSRTLRLASDETTAGLEVSILSQADTPLLPWSTHVDGHWKARVLPLPAPDTSSAS